MLPHGIGEQAHQLLTEPFPPAHIDAKLAFLQTFFDRVQHLLRFDRGAFGIDIFWPGILPLGQQKRRGKRQTYAGNAHTAIQILVIQDTGEVITFQCRSKLARLLQQLAKLNRALHDSSLNLFDEAS